MKSNKWLFILTFLFALNARASELETKFSPIILSAAMTSVIMNPEANLLAYAYAKPAEIISTEEFRGDLIRKLLEIPASRNSLHGVALVISSLLNRYGFQKHWGQAEQNLFLTCIEYLKRHGQGRSVATDLERDLLTIKSDSYATIRFKLQKPLEDLIKLIQSKPLELKSLKETLFELTDAERRLIVRRAQAIEQQLRESKVTFVCKTRLGDNDNESLPRK